MEIHDRNSAMSERTRDEPLGDVIDLTKTNRERIAAAARDVSKRSIEEATLTRTLRPDAPGEPRDDRGAGAVAAGDDVVELSPAALALAEGEPAVELAAGRERVHRMREALATGKLATPERVELAAARLLGG
jgi:hypothetical protein